MKPTNKKQTTASDPLVTSLIAQLRKSGVICGTGAEMNAIRAKQKK